MILPFEQLIFPKSYLVMLRAILAATVPHCEVRAYGSRVHGGGHEGSDLDLVVVDITAPELPLPELALLRQALQESNIPVLVEVIDWAAIPDYFKTEIEKGYVLIA